MKGKVLRVNAEQTKERIIKAVTMACVGRCELVVIKQSERSNSSYFTISNGRVQKFFRMSDHATFQKIKNLTVGKHTKMSVVERFVMGIINALNRRSLRQLLDSLSGNLAIA